MVGGVCRVLTFPFTGTFPRTHILQVTGIGLELSFCPVNAINPPRVKRYHSDSPVCPIWQLQTEKDVSTQCTNNQVTLLAVQRAGLPGWVPWLDHSRGHQVWKAGRHMQLVEPPIPCRLRAPGSLRTCWESRKMGRFGWGFWAPLDSTAICAGPALLQH